MIVGCAKKNSQSDLELFRNGKFFGWFKKYGLLNKKKTGIFWAKEEKKDKTKVTDRGRYYKKDKTNL